MIGVRESGLVCDEHLLVALDASLVGDFGCLGQRELHAALDVIYNLLKRDELVLEPRDLACVYVALDTRHVLVGPVAPSLMVRAHLVTRATAKRRLIGCFGDCCEAHAHDDKQYHR
jgi:hypothetical protein